MPAFEDGVRPQMTWRASSATWGGIVVRDYSCIVSNYRSQKSLDQYLKEQVPRPAACLAALWADVPPPLPAVRDGTLAVQKFGRDEMLMIISNGVCIPNASVYRCKDPREITDQAQGENIKSLSSIYI